MWPSVSHPDCLANDPDSRDALVGALGRHNGTYVSDHDDMFVRGYMTNDLGDKVPALVAGTGGGGNYDYTVFDPVATGYTGSDSPPGPQPRVASGDRTTSTHVECAPGTHSVLPICGSAVWGTGGNTVGVRFLSRRAGYA